MKSESQNWQPELRGHFQGHTADSTASAFKVGKHFLLQVKACRKILYNKYCFLCKMRNGDELYLFRNSYCLARFLWSKHIYVSAWKKNSCARERAYQRCLPHTSSLDYFPFCHLNICVDTVYTVTVYQYIHRQNNMFTAAWTHIYKSVAAAEHTHTPLT